MEKPDGKTPEELRLSAYRKLGLSKKEAAKKMADVDEEAAFRSQLERECQRLNLGEGATEYFWSKLSAFKVEQAKRSKVLQRAV